MASVPGSSELNEAEQQHYQDTLGYRVHRVPDAADLVVKYGNRAERRRRQRTLKKRPDGQVHGHGG